MQDKPVLIVDDEKNIRLTLSQALEPLGLQTDTAVNGEEALNQLKEKEYGLILLDLKMPGMDGMEVLRQVREIRPEIRVIIITAHGTIESAVEAMKLGAVDFLQKPFAPKEIRELVSNVIDREKLDEQKATDYISHIELAKKSIGDQRFEAAIEHVRRAIAVEPTRPEAFNLWGALLEILAKRAEAQDKYRTALSLDPTYEPARKNLERFIDLKKAGSISFGEREKSDKDRKEE